TIAIRLNIKILGGNLILLRAPLTLMGDTESWSLLIRTIRPASYLIIADIFAGITLIALSSPRQLEIARAEVIALPLVTRAAACFLSDLNQSQMPFRLQELHSLINDLWKSYCWQRFPKHLSNYTIDVGGIAQRVLMVPSVDMICAVLFIFNRVK